MKRRLFAFIVAILMCCPLSAPARAVSDIPVGQTSTFSEYDTYIKLKEATDEELLQTGYSVSEIGDIRNGRFEEALSERAALPEETLESMGYSENDIALLKGYDGHELSENDPVLMALATCTNSYYPSNVSSESMSYTITWTWDRAPLILGDDYFIMSWEGYNTTSNPVRCRVLSNSMTVGYHRLEGNSFYRNEILTVTNSSSSPENHRIENSGLKYTYKLGKNVGSDVWAKTVRVNVTIGRYDDQADPLNCIYLEQAYLHTDVETGIDFSISIADALSGSMSAALNFVTDRVFYEQSNTYANGTFEPYNMNEEEIM